MNKQSYSSPQRREFTSKEEFVAWLKQRTKSFAIRTITLCNALPRNQATQVIGYQLIKSATSLAANYRAACRGRSGAEFYSKMCTVVEESDESVFWYEVLMEANLVQNNEELEVLMSEAIEIVALMATVRKNTGLKLK